MKKVDLNCDLGESFGAYTIGLDERVIPHISSANVACGYHGGDPMVMRRTIALAKKSNVAVGAHPGFPDLMGFGRRNMTVTPDEAYGYMLYQLGALAAFAKAAGVRLQHVKPHGALYNMAGKDADLAAAIAQSIADFDPTLILLGLSGSAMLAEGEKRGLRCAKEVFADRAYNEDGSLVNRKLPGSMITDEEVAIARVLRMLERGEVETITGKVIPIEADSVCVHGDNEHALEFVTKIRAAIEARGIAVAPMGENL
ncbi:MAG: 5-oxoprolinase subunit PxpA [Clostridiaceae bacterium]|nr:5-oxoprolinase subunit PxpA [Clostridiaceae bacterium]